MANSLLTAQLFNVTFLPDQNIVYIKVNAISGLNSKVIAKVEVIAYGYKAITQVVNPCEQTGFEGLCPMVQGPITIDASPAVGDSVADQIPGTSDTLNFKLEGADDVQALHSRFRISTESPGS